MAGNIKNEGGKRTPLPLKPFISITVMFFTNSLSQTILFPFAAVMVKSFHVTDDPAKLGYYAGYLATSLFLGSLISCLFWGALSDKVGRKPILLTGLLANTACAFLFGTSRSLHVAMAVRFINGLFGSIMTTGRSAVAELCDESNQTQGFALISSSFGAGLLVGPALGGFLSLPAEKYPYLFPSGSLFDSYPFLLPCLVLSIMSLLGALFTFCFLPETRFNTHPESLTAGRSQPGSENPKESILEPSDDVAVGFHESSSSEDDLTQPLISDSVENGAEKELKEETGASSSSISLLTVLTSRDTVVATLLFCVLSFVSTSFNEVFPIWCITPKELGGLSFDTNQIGLQQTASGIALIPMQIYVYAPLVNFVGPVNALRFTVALGMFQIMFFPLVKVFGSDLVKLQAMLLFFMVLRSFTQCVFTSMFILVSNSVQDSRFLGSVNGVTQTLNMASRALAPTAGGSFFAWATSHRGSVVNSDSWFFVTAALYGSMFLLTFFMSSSADKRKFSRSH